MGVGRTANIRSRLMSHGRPGDTPVALEENGSTARQRVIGGTLAELAHLAERQALEAPAIVLVGEVASLAGRLDWFRSDGNLGERALSA